MIVSPLRRGAAVLALASLALGCVSVRRLEPEPLPASDEAGALELRVYASDHDRRAGVVGPRHVESVLERRERDVWVPVFRSLEPAWRVEDLAPGRYRVTLPSVLDAEGNPVPVEDARKTVRVRQGQLSRLEGNLDHVPKGAIAAGIVGAVIVGALLHEILDDLDLPTPPPELVDVAIGVTVDLAVWGGDRGGVRAPDRPPVVTSVFPEADALVAVPSLRVVVAFSEPLAAVEPDAIRVTADRSGPLPGTTFWDEEHWWLVWEPAGDLPPGEEIAFEVEPSKVRDMSGRALRGVTRSTFRTAG